MEYIIRRAQKADRAEILRFCSNTFDWGDYIEEVIDDWLLHRRGSTLVAVVQGRPVGMCRVDVVSADEAWFSGMRIAKEYRRMGLASALSRACIEEARAIGCVIGRMAIDTSNTASQSLARTLGFEVRASYAEMVAAPLDSRALCPLGVRQATTDDIETVFRIVRANGTGGLLVVDWEGLEASADYLADLARAGRLWVACSGDRPLAVATISDGDESAEIANMVGDDEALLSLATFARKRAATLSRERVTALCLLGSSNMRVAEQAGFAAPLNSDGVLIFERLL